VEIARAQFLDNKPAAQAFAQAFARFTYDVKETAA
jgi:hypothetical protein